MTTVRRNASDNPTHAQLIIVGKVIRSCDDGNILRMKQDGYKTGLKALGQYTLLCDSEMFDRIIEDHYEDEL